MIMSAHSSKPVTGHYWRCYSSALGAVKIILPVFVRSTRAMFSSSRVVFSGIAQFPANHKLLRGVFTKIKMLKDQSRRTQAFVYEIS